MLHLPPKKRDWRWPLLLPLILLVAITACDIEETVPPEPAPEALPTPLSGSVDHSVPVVLSWELDESVVWADSTTATSSRRSEDGSAMAPILKLSGGPSMAPARTAAFAAQVWPFAECPLAER